MWLNSLADTAPVANVTVKVFSKTNQLICQGTSDEKGSVYFKDLDFSGDRKPFVITASTDSDLSFLEIEKNVLSEADFDIQGRPYLSSGYEAFVYSDRGVYRPGEKVFIRVVVRAPGVALPEQFPVTVSLKRPDGKEFKKLSGVLSDFGTLDLDVDVPDYAMTGEYQASVFVPGNDKAVGELNFNVEEFIPDSLKVSVKLAAERYKIDDVIPLMVKVQESFGAVAAGRNIELSFKLNPLKFEPKAYKDFSFTDDTVKYNPKSIYVGGKVSDADGQGYFEIQLPKEIIVPSALEAAIKTVVRETGGRAVTNYSSVKVDPYSFYIGVRKSKEGFGKNNEPVGFDLLTLSPDESEQVASQLKVKVSKIIWSNILKKDEDGSYKYVTESMEEVVQQDAVAMSTARGVYNFTPKDWGDYIIRVTGAAPGAHTAALKFYVSGPWDSQPWAMERPDRVNVKFDKEKYAVGDTAKLLIQSPFKGKALIACSVDSVIYSQAVELSALTQEIEIPVTQEFSPNAYCSASVIRPLVYEENWSAHRAYGIAPLILDHKEHQLVVKVNAPDKVEPGKTLKLDIETAGEPSELSVAVVDDGILRLTSFKTPDPYEFFYAKRSNGILTTDIYSLLVPEVKEKKAAADSSPSGDRVARKHTNPVNAKRVKPVSLWQSKIRTDANGKATAEFTVPDFTGTLKFMVVAVGKSSFGNSDGDVKSIQPIVITPT
ncbi:MAG: MG2 domain-containing protein, partial [Candidatus Omnitrophota bacterium]